MRHGTPILSNFNSNCTQRLPLLLFMMSQTHIFVCQTDFKKGNGTKLSYTFFLMFSFFNFMHLLSKNFRLTPEKFNVYIHTLQLITKLIAQHEFVLDKIISNKFKCHQHENRKVSFSSVNNKKEINSKGLPRYIFHIKYTHTSIRNATLVTKKIISFTLFILKNHKGYSNGNERTRKRPQKPRAHAQKLPARKNECLLWRQTALPVACAQDRRRKRLLQAFATPFLLLFNNTKASVTAERKKKLQRKRQENWLQKMLMIYLIDLHICCQLHIYLARRPHN